VVSVAAACCGGGFLLGVLVASWGA